MTSKEIARLREASGNVEITSRLVSFLYELMRDHLPPGTVEGIVQTCSDPSVQYTNGWLARYAEDVAKRLLDETPAPTKAARPVPGPGKVGLP